VPTLYILLGPKGSGKSHIGRLAHARLGLTFLSVEPIFQAIKGTRSNLDRGYLDHGFALVRAQVEQLLRERAELMIESTGVFPGFDAFLSSLDSAICVHFIRVHAPLSLCKVRVLSRDRAGHVAVDADHVDAINARAAQVSYPCLAIIDNSAASDDELVAALQRILPVASQQ
jgi:adenylate kinase family enzyme